MRLKIRAKAKQQMVWPYITKYNKKGVCVCVSNFQTETKQKSRAKINAQSAS